MSQINLDKYYDYVQYQEIVEYYFSYIQIIIIQIIKYYFSFNYSYIRNNLHHNHSIKNHHVWML